MLVTVGQKGKKVGVFGFYPNQPKRLSYYLVSLGTNYDGPATAMKDLVQKEYRDTLKNFDVIEQLPSEGFCQRRARSHLHRRGDVQEVPSQYLREMVHDQALPGLQRTAARRQAEHPVRRGMRELPHDRIRIQLGLAVRGQDSLPGGQSVRKLPRTGLGARGQA